MQSSDDAIAVNTNHQQESSSNQQEDNDASSSNNQVLELLQKVEEAMFIDEDYERAATYLDSIYELPHEEVDLINKLLVDREKLCDIVKTNFVASMKYKRESDFNRYTKLIDMLDMEQDGLVLYTNYVIDSVSSEQIALIDAYLSKVTDLMEYSDEDISPGITFSDISRQVMDIHISAIENCIDFIDKNFGGSSNIIYIIIQLQPCLERDMKSIFDEFMSRRRLIETLTSVQLYNMRDIQTEEDPSTSEVDTKELGLLLDEMSELCSHTEMYDQFIREKANTFSESEHKLPSVCNLVLKMQEIIAFYIPLDDYFINSNISRAIELNTINSSTRIQSEEKQQESEDEKDEDSQESEDEDESEKQLYSSVIDDIFFILHKAMKRACISRNYSVMCAILNHINLCLTERLLKELSRAFNRGERRRSPDDSYDPLSALLSALNDYDTCAVYTLRLKVDFEKYCDKLITIKSQNTKLKSVAHDLTDISKLFQTSAENLLNQLVTASIEPIINKALGPLTDEIFSYVHETEEDTENSEIFIEELVLFLEKNLNILSKKLMQNCWNKMIEKILTLFTTKLEDIILEKEFNHLGAFQFEKDLRQLQYYFSDKTQIPIRDKFSRLNEMAFLLKLNECEDILDFWGGGTITWRLTPQEVKFVLSLRIEFDSKAFSLQLS
jgi:hypothetical protein